MLFDLRGRGRRRTIKVIYVTLALLMGGGLVLFGIGGEVSGGLIDAITERGASSDDADKRLEKRETDALAATRRNPKDTNAWAELARARYQLASTGDGFDPNTGAYTATGKRKLQQASDAWERYLSLDPDPPDIKLASIMVSAYTSPGGIEDFGKATRAQEIVTQVNDDKPGPFEQLAVLAYAAGQTRKGDLAADKALELTEPDKREALKGQLESAKSQGILNQAQQGQGEQ